MKNSQERNKTPLVDLNALTPQENGVFISAETVAAGLSYSDGDAEEQYIYNAVTSVQDLSSLSEELRSYERDWASECHLSSKRANVFRALNLSGVQHVLEIGSGCGAITRFLGEQQVNVDAVEGSLRRADITRRRCRDLDNVTVIHADFNALLLPDTHYDLVVLTGVLEYAGKFSSDGVEPMAVTVSMLERITRCLGPGGSIIIAIENRIGFKYLAGASEDHFARPWVGLSNYPDCDDSDYREKQGIRTWDKRQWYEILQRLPGITAKWYYPFPDYKLATTLLSEEFVQRSPYAGSCLSRVRSRDYTAIWHSPIDEQLFWQTAASAMALGEMANSFVLVLQGERSNASTQELVPFDFVHFSGHDRKAEYRIMVEKRRGESCVRKTALASKPDADNEGVITQHFEEEPYFEGKLLVEHWVDVLRACTSSSTFDGLLKQYYQYVLEKCAHETAGKLLDLLPFNIVVAEDGNWHGFDQEWRTEKEVSPQFIFFRAVLYFYAENKESIKPFCKQHHLKNGWEFIDYCLERILYTSEFDCKGFIELENTIQQAISHPEAIRPIESILDSTPDGALERWSWEKTSLVWGEKVVVSRPVSSTQTELGQRIVFNLPNEACGSSFIQLSLGLPNQDVGLAFKVHSFHLYGRRHDGTRETLLPAEPDQIMPPLIKLTGLTFCPDVQGGVFVVEKKEPQVLHFFFPGGEDSPSFKSLDAEVAFEFLGRNGARICLEQCRLENQNLANKLKKEQQQRAQVEQSRVWRTLLALKKMVKTLIALFNGMRGSYLGKRGEPASAETEQDYAEPVDDSAGKPQGELISVVLAVYNTGAHELRQTVDSVLNQSYPDWELIIVDSSSTDESTLQALAGIKHSKIKIHYLKKSDNLTMAMDKGLALARGKWITFLGHFDRYRTDALRTCALALEKLEADMVYCDEEIINRAGEVMNVTTKSEFHLDSLDGRDVIGNALFIRRSLIDQVGGLDHEFDGVQLFDLVLRASRDTEKIVYLNEALYQTRQCEPPTEEELDRLYSVRQRAWERKQS